MKSSEIAEIRHFNRFYTKIIGLLDQHILGSGYALPEVRVMFELYHQPGSTSTKLIEVLDLDKGYLSRMLKQFERKKLITKTVLPYDRRNVSLFLSPLGKSEFEQLDANATRHIGEVFSSYSPSTVKGLIKKMQGIESLITNEQKQLSLDDIVIRNEIQPGDLGYVIHRHGKIYGDEYGFGVPFESYVATTIHEFYSNYDPGRDRVWICEHDTKIIGFLALMHRSDMVAQLRYFYLEKPYRGIGLGSKLMKLFMESFAQLGYKSAYLLTTDELTSAASLYKRYGFELTSSRKSMSFGRQLMEQRYDLV